MVVKMLKAAETAGELRQETERKIDEMCNEFEGVIGIYDNRIQFDTFTNLTKATEKEPHLVELDDSYYPYKLTVQINGIEFLTILSQEQFDELDDLKFETEVKHPRSEREIMKDNGLKQSDFL